MGGAEGQTTACPEVGAACCPEILGGIENKLLCLCACVCALGELGGSGMTTHATCVHFPTSRLFQVTLARGCGRVALPKPCQPQPGCPVPSPCLLGCERCAPCPRSRARWTLPPHGSARPSLLPFSPLPKCPLLGATCPDHPPKTAAPQPVLLYLSS